MGIKNKLKRSLKGRRRKDRKDRKDKNTQLFSIPYSTIENHLTDEEKSMFCTSNPGRVYVRYKQPSCDSESQDAESELETCNADKAVLRSQINDLTDELSTLKSEISNYVPVGTVNEIMNNGFCVPYSQLKQTFDDVEIELGNCQTAYNNRTNQLNAVYEKYKDDVKKYHETIKEIIGNGDTSVINEERQQIYKEESLLLQEKIRKNWRKLYVAFVILMVVMVLCTLKFFDFI